MIKLTKMAALVGLVALACPSVASAQELTVKFDRIRNTVSVTATRADVYDVVQQLFSQAGAPQVDVARNVRGRVTTNLSGVTRDSALSTILSQVDASYRVENGIYYVRTNRSGGDQRDDRGQRGDRTGGGSGSDPVDEKMPAGFDKRVNMVARDRPIGEVTGSLARMGGVVIKIDREIPGDLMLDVMARDEVLWTVLRRIASVSHLKIDSTAPREITFRPLPSFAAYYRGRRIGSSGELFSCRNCRFNEIKRGWRFCPMCGERIDR